jgi:N6-L-threonylcarbamoyladenine synthase
LLILGIDTSCDDTSAAVVEDGTAIISNVVSGQSEIHAKYGGIVPELASRRHIEMIRPVVDEALKGAGTSLSDIGAVAVCHGPGLIGSLLVGCSFAKAICYAKGTPLVAVNHLEGHILSALLVPPFPEFPFLSLVVSGGHTSLYLAEDFCRYEELGRTRDDAAGEAYDKVSKLLGLGYPGGPIIDLLAQQGDARSIDFPRAYLPGSLDFSFSGMKTAVSNFLRSNGQPGDSAPRSPLKPGGGEEGVSTVSGAGGQEVIRHIAASFQAAVVDVLVRKTEWAIRKKRVGRVTVSGGVAANSELRRRMKEMGEERGVEVFVPPAVLCTDNAAMIAAAGYRRFIKGDRAGLDLNPRAHLPL